MSKKKKSSFQFSILTVLLLMAAMATWFTGYLSKRDGDHIARRLPSMRNVARELNIVDPEQYAVSKRIDDWYGERIWNLYLPDEAKYKICFATNGITKSLFCKAGRTVEMLPGQYELEYRSRRIGEDLEIIFLVDGKVVYTKTLRKESDDSTHTASEFNIISVSEQHLTSKPMALVRQIFAVQVSPNSFSTPKKPSAGVLIWVEKDGIEKSKSLDN